MDFASCFHHAPAILMEGALGERLKREFSLGFDPQVAMAGLVYTAQGRKALATLWEQYMALAKQYDLPFLCTTPTRRANKERVACSAFSESILLDNILFLQQIRKAQNNQNIFIGGLMGCKGDAYQATEVLSVEEAQDFHAWQANLFKKAGAEFLMAGIMPALSEAVGMAKAMEETSLPYIISFMIQRNGKLLDQTTIHQAIEQIDAQTTQKPLCYMTNCVHPLVAFQALSQPYNQTPLVWKRFQGIQANTSPLPLEELDQAKTLQTADPYTLAQHIMALQHLIPLKIYGGCCGTDQRHMEQMAKCLYNQYR